MSGLLSRRMRPLLTNTAIIRMPGRIGGETGQEQAVVGETVENTNMNVTVRYCTETAAVISTKYRILFGDDIYDILAVDHLNYKKNALKFKCRKVRQS